MKNNGLVFATFDTQRFFRFSAKLWLENPRISNLKTLAWAKTLGDSPKLRDL